MKKLQHFIVGLCLLSTITANNAICQTLFSKAEYPQPVSASPEASALGKYGEIPVSLFSGLPNIGIPMYTFKEGDISIPVGLNYNAGGIKVNEVATYAGLGWSLNAGGVISKSIQGAADESNDLTIYEFPGKTFNPNNNDPFSADYIKARTIIEESKDTERDIYYYNFMGYTGKFMIDRLGKAHCYPANPNIRIEQSYENHHYVFKVTDDKGYRYFFKAVEVYQTTPVCSVGIPQQNEFSDGMESAYYLTKVISPNKHEVNLEYEGNVYTIDVNYKEIKYIKSFGDCAELNSQNRVCRIKQLVGGLRIKRIKSADNQRQVVFTYSTTLRLDLKYNNQDQGNYLEKVSIINGSNTLKEWFMTYGYFGIENNLRLKLLTVKEDNRPPYEFTYDEQYPLPERLSFSQDYWGYYNGKSNYEMIPSVPSIGYNSTANRTPDFNFMKSASLKRIHYPTGGYTDFEYEPHKNLVTQETQVTESVSLNNTNNEFRDFTLPVGATDLSLYWNLPKINFDDFFDGYIFGGTGYATQVYHVSGEGSTLISTGIGNQQLTPGNNYRIYLMGANGNDLGTMSLSWKKLVSTPVEGIAFGGLRIKSVKSYSSAAQLASSKFYKYNWVHDTTKTTMIMPATASTYLTFNSLYEKLSDSNPLNTPCTYNVLSSSFMQSMGMAALDNSIGYEQVTEYDQENGSNGRSIYRYQSNFIEGAKGALKEKLVQKFESGVYKPIQKTVNVYEFPLTGRDTIPNFQISYYRQEFTYGAPPGTRMPAIFSVHKYDVISAKMQLQGNQEIVYNAAGNDSLVTVSNYTYGNPLYIFPTVTRVTDSRSKVMRTENKYVHDIAAQVGAPGVYIAMRDSNIIAPLIEQRVYNETDGNALLSYKKTNYADWNNTIYQPQSVETAAYSASPITEINIGGYDARGNVLTYTPRNQAPISYQWTSDYQYPIAECRNALNNEFYVQNYEESGTTAANAHTGFKCFVGSSTSVSWTPPNGRSYVISYWYRTGGAWKYSEEQTYNGSSFNLTGGDAYDDVRIYPKDAFLKTFTYDPMVGMTSSLDEKGNASYYVYDNYKRLQDIKDANGRIIKHMDYHYQGQ